VKDRPREREFTLSEAEALALLEILMVCPAELNADQRTATLKLSEFCREFLRDERREAREIVPLRADIAIPRQATRCKQYQQI